MTEEPLSQRRGLYERSQAGDVSVRHVEVPGGDGLPLAVDVYSSAASATPRQPAVVLVNGYPDPGFQRIVGCVYKDMGAAISWARLIAMSGLVAVTYANRNAAADLDTVLRHLAEGGDRVGIEGSRLGLLASSGHVPLALAALGAHRTPRIACAALLYGYLLDLDGATHVADAQRQFRFMNPAVAFDDLSDAAPVLIVRAGRDEMPGLNACLDRFVAQALVRNMPLTLVNHQSAPHAFELALDDHRSRATIRQVIEFLVESLQRS